MKEWKEYNIGEICDTISDTYDGNASNVVLINTSDVLEGKCLNHTFVPNKDLRGQFKKQFKKNDILYSEIRPANKRYAFIDFEPTDYIASTKLMVIRSNDKVLPKFLYYILQSKEMIETLQFLAESRSGTFPQITFSELAIQTILLPEVKEQNKIVNFLEALDSKIELNRRINGNLEQQVQALFKAWFVDFEPFKNGKFVDSELGKIPEGWKVGQLDELVEIKYGKDHKKLLPGNIPVYGSGGIMRHVNMPIYEKESVLIPRKGSLNNVLYVNHPFWTVDTMFYTRMKINGIAKFIYLFISPIDLLSMNNGSAVPSMTTEILSKIRLVIPSKNIFDNFESLVAPSFDKIGSCNKEICKLSNLRDTLLPKLLSGELSINTITE